MKRWQSALILISAAVLAVSGCVPRRLFWSPDGQRAAVLADDGLRLCDGAGKLSDALVPEVDLVAWLPDSKHVIVSRKESAKTWEQAAALLTPEKREQVLKMVEPFRQEVFAYNGDWDKFASKAQLQLSGGEFSALVLYVREHANQGLRDKVGEKKWTEVEELAIESAVLQLYAVSDLHLEAGQVLAKSMDAFTELRLSPDGKTLACVQEISSKDKLGRLSVLPIDGGEMRTVAEPTAMYPDWSQDGQRLVYATTRTPQSGSSDQLTLGTVTERPVCGDSGELLVEFGAPKDLVGGLFWVQMKIRCLKSGAILFSGMEVTLPATANDMPQRASLFSVEPGKRATAARVLPRDAEASLPDGLGGGFWELSPDQTRVAVLGLNGCAVSVLTLTSGEVQVVSPELADKDVKVVGQPAWRTAGELAVFAPPKSKLAAGDRAEVVLWSGPDKTRCLSCDWPAIFEKKETSQPANAPASETAK